MRRAENATGIAVIRAHTGVSGADAQGAAGDPADESPRLAARDPDLGGFALPGMAAG